MKAKKKKSNQKPKLNITLHEDTKQKLTALAQLEKRSVSNLIEIMADERWEKLAEREGVDYGKTVAEIAGLKGLSADKEADRKVFRREILERVLKFKKDKRDTAGIKSPSRSVLTLSKYNHQVREEVRGGYSSTFIQAS